MDFDAAQLRHVLDSAGVAILATDVDERIIYWSRAAADLFGCSAADAHGRSFIELEDAYDLLLSDVMMPGMTGSQLAAEASRLCPALPVVFMSGYTDTAASPHPDLPKPFTREQLLACIHRSLG